MKENNNIDPCLNALNPNSWNKKVSDVEVCGWNGWQGWKYPNVDVLECFNLYQGKNKYKTTFTTPLLGVKSYQHPSLNIEHLMRWRRKY